VPNTGSLAGTNDIAHKPSYKFLPFHHPNGTPLSVNLLFPQAVILASPIRRRLT
jgi:hypothetical protein